MDTKIIKRFFGLADFIDEQVFLEEQHRQGWKFKEFKWLRKYTFEKCTPQKYVYQLDYKEDDKDEESYIQLFVDCGWEYVMKYQTWYYFRKPKSLVCKADNEILSDTESKIDMVKKVMNRTSLIVFICLWFPFILLTNVFMRDFMSKDLAFQMIMIIYAIIFAGVLGLNLGNIVKLNKLIKKYQNPLDEEK